MKLNKLIILPLFIVANIFTLAAQTDRKNAPEADMPVPLNLGEMYSFQLENGLKVFLAEKKGYTRFTVSVNIEQLPLEDDNNQLRSVLSQILMQKETAKYPAGVADSTVSYLGAQLAVTPTGGYIKGMKRDVDELFSIYSNILLEPAFCQETIDSVGEEYKNREARVSLRKKEFNLSSVLIDSLLMRRDKTPRESDPYVQYSVDEVKEFYREKIVANNSLIVIIGDFSRKESEKLVRKYFGNWNQGEKLQVNRSVIEKKPELAKSKIFVIDNPDAVQSKISISWNLDDAYQYFEKEVELEVMNEIFGATAMSYLSQNLREDKGLCYFAVSNIGPSASGGTGFINTSVRNSETAYALENIFLEMLRIRNVMVSDKDLKAAKNSLAGSFARSISGASIIPYISFAMAKEEFNLPDDYLQTKISRIYRVTKEDVNKAAKRYIKPYSCVVMVQGKVADIKDTLEKFGDVCYYTEDGKEIFPEKSEGL